MKEMLISVIEKMKNETMQEASEKVKSLSNLKETQEYVELQQLHNVGISPIKSTDITGSLKGRSNVISRLRELIDSAQKEILICTSIIDFEDKSRVLMPALEKLAKSNIKVKLVLSGDPEKIKKLNSKISIKSKSTETKARFFVVDNKEILFMVTPETAEEEMGVWLNSPFFSESLSNIVDSSLRAQH